MVNEMKPYKRGNREEIPVSEQNIRSPHWGLCIEGPAKSRLIVYTSVGWGLWIIDIRKKEGGVSQLDSIQRTSPSGLRFVKRVARSRGMGIPDQVIDT